MSDLGTTEAQASRVAGAEEEGDAGRIRRLSGLSRGIGQAAFVLPVLAAALWAVEAQHYVGVLIFNEQFLAAMLGLGLAATFLNVKARTAEPGDRVPVHDWILAAGALVVTGYVVVNFRTLVHELSSLEPLRIGLGVLAVALIAEATRRLIGWTLVVVALFFILYARFGDLMPGVFAVPPSSWERIAVYVYLDTNSILGTPLNVAANTIATFILFGAILKAVKGDTFITDLAMLGMGRFRGGPAKVSVGASTLFGTVSGSAVSNVAIVGPISIPMMEKAGYPRQHAAAIEAVASTGGQIMPPVMGITAFLMADFLSIPYSTVVLAALLPAILYYVAVFVQVDLEAAARGLKGVPREALPRWAPTLRRLHLLLVPLAVLIWTIMFAYWSPGRAGLAAAGTALVMGLITPSARPGLRVLWNAVVSTGQTVANILVLTAIAGVVIGAIQLSGLGFSMSSILLALAGDEVILILVMTGLVCVILGMALPTAVIYTMLAVLVAPALVQLGVDRLAAHMFIFYMGMLSMITPPVCFATFTAASIARAPFWPTAIAGMRYGIAAYLLPFVFPWSPGLLMQGGPVQVALAFGTACIGVAAIAAGLVGFLFRPLGLVPRALFIALGLAAMLSPFVGTATLIANVVGLAGLALMTAGTWIAARRDGPAPATTTTVTGRTT
ncbi:TRAP transporter permease [Wenxinia marina]|uniref:TRAP transporter, 4TM/12TM fusion protein n=1 Tax=Wenxinia marina DSM 24838 TaxID=1123501 RepID=A0A0D0Q754_9RHOB|nr:TRAP transporter fused permease subunit [Wenxinia marina]KIQ68287.1 TRAP transporter, 4TM/12TM fusion protein [Wenxinia marina DSM 24838]GGL79441.1 C4-dicarboxylate ABC transporter permease [Wenxinia marina]